ncbi:MULTISPECIES: lipoyl(octanoyl) transferase LipB [Corynebacterium]|uniref:lipoyl(octanoyl) transferase LipB n=1 Tax=Corynebacterium TaxID=1716 RepID=UPI0008A27A91|nr:MULTISPECIES: lipoyl(octanoyl) transferase LipB [Corynebacterium]MCT1441274.1 lipoyl(octanoyl) transferase LipB [Corynebacterium glucuronolyticum]MCT1562320.1 lipoyl(octanoyl) transferase LipB [Corynebacterium glucuronolyticum]OFO42389.1 lipoate-protein ligase B [Corynebacterium sp. HMSC073D01]QQU89234.1 lipoyl(octanoyl) transferase LipB [Corynebacterium glucuronolyticum]
MTAPRPPFTPSDQPIRKSSDPIDVRTLGEQSYKQMWDEQAKLALQRHDEEIPDTILVLEHPSVYTAGKRTQPEDRPTISDIETVDIDRGGRITWHGPGQLVCYPIIKLDDPVDVVDYVRRLEEAIIQTVRHMGIHEAGRIDGRSGVWVPASDGKPDRKLAAIGIRITRGVTMHGIAVNCDNTLEYYDYIVPCGISDAGVTTMSDELGRDVTVEEVTEPLVHNLIEAFEGRLQVADHTFGSAPDPTKGLPHRRHAHDHK